MTAQPITDLGSAKVQKDEEERVETSLVPKPVAIGQPLYISTQSN